MIKDVENKPGWIFDDALLDENKKSVDAKFDENRAKELGLSEDEIKKEKENFEKGNTITVVKP